MLRSCPKMPLKCILSKIDHEEYKELEEFTITHGTVNTRFGKCLMGIHENQICFLSFIDDTSSSSGNIGTNCSYGTNCTSELKKLFPNARFYENNGLILRKVEEIFDENTQGEVKVLVKGSAFQIKIWEQLVNLRRGSTTTYEDIAKAIGHPKAVRPVATAIAKNNIAYLIPCHRVISKNKTMNKYRWGAERKLNMLREESAIAKKEMISKYFSPMKKKES